MGGKALGQHLKNLKLTYGLTVSHGMKAVGQILFQICRSIPLEIKPDNVKSLCHGRVMQMEEQSQDFPGDASRSFHREESRSVWKGNKPFPPR